MSKEIDRVEISTEYAAACQQAIDECGDDYKKGCALIEHIQVPENIHPMLVPINLFAYDIVADFRGDENDKHYWELIKTKVEHFLTGDWESTTWWAMIMYGHEEKGVLKHSYSLSIHRQGSDTTYESGNERLIEVIKELAGSIDQHQTDEWFMYALLKKLPKEVDGLLLQSTQISEAVVPEWDES